jgi:hypothetical protein
MMMRGLVARAPSPCVVRFPRTNWIKPERAREMSSYHFMAHRHIDVDLDKGLPLEAIDDIIE